MKSSKNNNAMIKKIIEETVVSILTEQILNRVALHGRKALVVFTEAVLGFEDALGSLRELKEYGLSMSGVVAPSRDEALDRAAIREALGVTSLRDSMGHIEAMKLASESDFVIVPTLSISSAAKLANGITDSLATGLIQAALLKGTQIIASRDASCPDNKTRNEMGFFANDAYRFMMAENLDKLSSYGIRLTSSRGLMEAVVSEGLCIVSRERRIAASAGGGGESDLSGSRAESTLRGIPVSRSKVLALGDINSLGRGAGLRIGKDVKVTALAAERIREMRIKLIRE